MSGSAAADWARAVAREWVIGNKGGGTPELRDFAERLAALLYSVRHASMRNAIAAVRRELLEPRLANDVEHAIVDQFSSRKLWFSASAAMPTSADSLDREPTRPPTPAGVCSLYRKSDRWGGAECCGTCGWPKAKHDGARPPAARLDGAAAPSGLDAAIAALGKLGHEDAGAAVVGGALVGLLGGLLLGGGAPSRTAGEGVLTSKTRVDHTQVRQEPGIKGRKGPKSPTKQRGVKSQKKQKKANPPSV